MIVRAGCSNIVGCTPRRRACHCLAVPRRYAIAVISTFLIGAKPSGAGSIARGCPVATVGRNNAARDAGAGILTTKTLE